MKTILFCFLLLNFCDGLGQPLSWHEGSVVMTTNEVLTGKISVEPVHSIILFEDDGIRTVFPAHKIKTLYFYDATSNINRRYASVKEHNVSRTQYQLFEVVLQGEVSVLRRQRINSGIPSDATDFIYLISYHNELIPLRKFKQKLYPALVAATGNELRDYVSSNGLAAMSDCNSIRIIEFYNRMVRSAETLAKF